MTHEPQPSRRIPEIFALVSEAPERDRATVLASACGDDEELRREVESLLKHADVVWDTFDHAAGAMEHALSSYGGEASEAVDPPMLDRIGAYRIIRVLGRGGMGVVYLAEQENPRRTVALKVIRSDGSSGMLRRRFEREAQVLGRLQHPGIAQIFEAGFADMGHGQQPFFAMEFVDGVPLNTYVRQPGVTERDRLTLMVRICDAVQHAHERGVIHRDLKPGNILVTEDGLPRLLDFGIARLIDAGTQDLTVPTMTGQLVGTIAYMSPEQMSGRVHEVGPHSDVYALGVLLYQVLAGRLPHDVGTLTIPQAVRVIEEEEPTPLCQISRMYRGDLDTIAGKALERDVDRRYPAAADLQRDLQRYLDDEPIVARPPSQFYQARKFIRRNKVIVAATTAVLVALLGGIIGIGLALVEANEQRDDARRQFRRAYLVNEFLNSDLLAQADPFGDTGPSITLREALDNASEVLETRFADEPLVEADIRMTLARTYRRLDEIPTAVRHVERALELRRAELGDVDSDVAAAVIELATLTSHVGEYARSELLHREALTMQRKLLSPDDPELLESLNRFGVILLAKGEFVEAEQVLREVLDRRRASSTDDSDLVADCMHWLAYTMRGSGKLGEAERLFREAMSMRQRLHGDSHATVASSLKHLAILEHERGNLTTSGILFKQSLVMYQEALGDEHMYTTTLRSSYGRLLLEAGRLDEAESMLRLVERRRSASRGESHADTWHARVGVAAVHLARDDAEAAVEITERALQVLTSLASEQDPYLADALLIHASALMDSGRPREALEPMERAVAIYTAAAERPTQTLANAQALLAICLLDNDRLLDAIPLIEAALRTFNASTFPRSMVLVALDGAIRIYERAGRSQDAELCRRQAELARWTTGREP